MISIAGERQSLPARTGLNVGVFRQYEVEQRVIAFDATVRVPVQMTPSGWQYKAKPVKLGGLLTFETITYIMDGWILDVDFAS